MRLKSNSPQMGHTALLALIKEGSPLGPLKVMARQIGRFFQIPIPGFRPFVVFGPEANRNIWTPILKPIKFISPGMWIVWRNMPRFGFRKPLQDLDDYLFRILSDQRAASVMEIRRDQEQVIGPKTKRGY